MSEAIAPTPAPVVRWSEQGVDHVARWRSERGAPPPKRVEVVDDTLRADDAFSLATQGTGLLWRGDFHNARQLLVALAHRVDRAPRRSPPAGASPVDVFNRVRMARAQRARTLGALLVPLEADHGIPLRRAPDLRAACTEAWGPGGEGPSVVSLRELQGLVGAHEWRVNGIEVPAAGGRIHPHYGVFAPTRREYVGLVAEAPLGPAVVGAPRAFDIGTGTGVLAAVLARRGFGRVVATDTDPRALACARENIERLGLASRVDVTAADLFPEGRAAIVVCNPPWLPARPASPLERAVYDEGSRMLRGFLDGLAAHLEPGGEGWLVLSDLAERLGLRSREALTGWIAAAGLRVLARMDARPAHPKALDRSDPLNVARAGEVTSLWRLGVA
ncbi:MAG: class I SAM-dependent methyltransferase [Burkholderiales bacterium]|jgi:SAM-dependent methyltransferase